MSQRVPESYRNCGSSFGLEHAFIYGQIQFDDGVPFADLDDFDPAPKVSESKFCVWNRHTGEIVHTETPDPGLWEGFARDRAMRECERLCAIVAGYADGRLPIDIGAIDSTP